MKILILLSFVALFWYFVMSFKKFRKENRSKNNDAASGDDSRYLGSNSTDCSNADNGGNCGGGDGGSSD